mgnify:CR=1 FL=1
MAIGGHPHPWNIPFRAQIAANPNREDDNPKNTFNIIDVIDGKFLVKTNIDAPNGKIILF